MRPVRRLVLRPLHSRKLAGIVHLSMSQDRLIILRSASGHVRRSRKNKKKVERKIELLKFDPNTRKREIYKEAKK